MLNHSDLKFEFARNWCGYEIWELKDESGQFLGDVDVKKTDDFFAIYNLHSSISNQGYGTYMYEKIKKQAIEKGCKWLIGEWTLINEGNKHFLDKLMKKESFKEMLDDDERKLGITFPNKPCIIKELIHPTNNTREATP